MKKVDFLFIYEVRNRELENVALLASELKRRGYSVAFLNSWACLNLKYPSYDAEVLVLSACYNTGTYQFFTGHAANFRKVVNLQWEQVIKNGYAFSEEVTSWHFSGDGLVSRHVCWGENTKRRLTERFGIAEEFLKVCGYISLDFYRPEFKDFIIPKEKLFQDNGLDVNKITALFISSFGLVGMPENLTGIGNNSLKATDLRTAQESQKAMLEWFRVALAKHPQVQFIYRFHPIEIDKPELVQLQRDFHNFHCISCEAVKHWIVAADKVYNWLSSAAIEVYCCKKQTFILRPIPVPWEGDLPIFEDCKKIEIFDEFEKSLSLPIDTVSQPLKSEVVKDYYLIDDAPVYSKICDFFVDTYKSSSYKSQQYNLHNTAFDRWKIRAYTSFWNSSLNIFFVKLAKRTSINIGFLNCRRTQETPTKVIDTENFEYQKSRTKVNEASDATIFETMKKFDNILK